MEDDVTGTGLIYLAIIAFGAYVLICHECGKVAKRKGIKYFDTLLIAFFGSPVVGLLYIITQQLPVATSKETEDV